MYFIFYISALENKGLRLLKNYPFVLINEKKKIRKK